jgi:hypothetical protein
LTRSGDDLREELEEGVEARGSGPRASVELGPRPRQRGAVLKLERRICDAREERLTERVVVGA